MRAAGARLCVTILAVASAQLGLQRSDEIPLGIDDRDHARIEASIRQAFPSAEDWVLSAADVPQWTNEGIDRRVHVDVPAATTGGRVARHVRFDCERREQTGAWSCGEHWQMLWQVERPVGQCAAPLMGLDASLISDEEVVLDTVDFFSTAAGSDDRVAIPGCGRIRSATLCRVSHISPGSPRRGDDDADLEVRLVAGPSSAAVIGVNRHCGGVGPCLLEMVWCTKSVSN